MAELNIDQLVNTMTNAAKNVLGDKKWAPLLNEAQQSFRNLGNAIIEIEKAKLSNQIDEESAKIMIEANKTAIQDILLSNKEISKILIEEVLNAVVNSVKNLVNTTIGLKIF